MDRSISKGRIKEGNAAPTTDKIGKRCSERRKRLVHEYLMQILARVL
jgi:hypothetical protein